MLLKKLVIADDDDAIAHLVGASLGDAGFLCLRAKDGEAALNLVRTELPDILLLDVMLPRMDGIEVCRRIKSDVLLSRVPILMLTSLSDVENRLEGFEAGADDYLAKPFDLRELGARVQAMIRQSRRERDRNPTTNLPGREAIEDRVMELMGAGKPFTVLYADIENFRAYADAYGFRKADEVIAHTGRLILSECRMVDDAPPFVGHVGGDDFLVLCEDAEVARRLRTGIHESFRETTGHHYTEEDRQAGCIASGDELDDTRGSRLMAVSIAIVDVEPSQYQTTEELAREITRVKAETRRRTASGPIPATPPPSDAGLR